MIISDFLDDADVEKPLQYLSDYGHELTLIQVWAPQDREPAWEGELELEDAETGGQLEIALDKDAAASYRDAFDEYSRRLNDFANRTGGRYVGLSTDMGVQEAIFDSLMRAGAVQ
jgi:hypothetical protein